MSLAVLPLAPDLVATTVIEAAVLEGGETLEEMWDVECDYFAPDDVYQFRAKVTVSYDESAGRTIDLTAAPVAPRGRRISCG